MQRSGLVLLLLADHAVAHADVGLDILGVAGVHLQLFAQSGHEDAERVSDAEFEFEHEVEYQRYFCNKHEKNKPEEWIRLDAEYDVDQGSWSNGSDYGRECFATMYKLDPLAATLNPFIK